MQLIGFWDRLSSFADTVWRILDTTLAEYLAESVWAMKDTWFDWLYDLIVFAAGRDGYGPWALVDWYSQHASMRFSLLEFILGAGFFYFVGFKLLKFLWDLLPIV